MSTNLSHPPPETKQLAVVVGLCAHGLAIVRALHRAGVEVVAIEANMALPGTRTRCARVTRVAAVDGPALIQTLLDVRPTLKSTEPPVLFLTNDRMVAAVGQSADVLGEHYRISWLGARDALLPLLRKDRIEQRCRETGLNYPRTRLVREVDALSSQVAGLTFPVIIKPVQPLSRFKTIVAESPGALACEVAKFASSLPVVIQEFIAGTDERIRFGALYLHGGLVTARFEGRKLRSRPMGHTTIAVAERNDAIHDLATRFFAGLDVSGPVSLELKEAPDGAHWVIEPTVGRTDFWVGLCVANGINLPLIEFQNAARLVGGVQGDDYIWINGERDPGALLWLLLHHPSKLVAKHLRGVFVDSSDIRPLLAHAKDYVANLPVRAMRRLGRSSR